MSVKKDIKKLRKDLLKEGWREKQRGSGHIMLFAPNGIGKTTISTTPSDQGAFRKILKDVENARNATK